MTEASKKAVAVKTPAAKPKTVSVVDPPKVAPVVKVAEVTKSAAVKKVAAVAKVTPKREPTPEPEEPEEVTPDAADDEDLVPYPFYLSEDKGKKAAVRFRENLRKYYPASLGLADGLTLRDKPTMELYCFDPDSQISYCRIWSKKHEGPFFANIVDLYTHYNLSKQGHPVDVFTYAGTDDDRNRELSDFLKRNEINNPKDLTPKQREFFEQAVAANPMIAAYEEAIALKKKHKAEETTKKRAAEGSDKATSAPDDEDGSANKKRPGRPKGSRSASGGESSTKRSRTKSGSSDVQARVSFVPTAMRDLQVDRADVFNTTVTLDYRASAVRFGDLAPGSVERNAVAWSIFADLVASDNGLGIKPTMTPEALLNAALDGGPMEIGDDELAAAAAEGDEGFAKGGDDEAVDEDGEPADYPEDEDE